MKAPNWKWFIEFTSPSQAHMHGISRYVYCGQTKYQAVEIADTEFYGRALILDGKIQSAEHDEYIYHEILVHPGMVLHNRPEEILVVGGGEGAVLREVLRHPSVKRVVMVDIDREVVELCKRYLPGWSNGAFDDQRVEVVYTDARKYIKMSGDYFDLVIMDLTEPVDNGPSYLLFTKQFFQLVYNRLKEDGIITLQSGSFNPRLISCHGAIYNTLKLISPVVRSYGTFIPSYDSSWGFSIATKGADPCRLCPEDVDNRLRDRGINNLLFYDGETHHGVFCLTKDVRTAREKEKRVIEDDRPLFIY